MTNPLAKYKVHIHNNQVCVGAVRPSHRPKTLNLSQLRSYLLDEVKIDHSELKTAEIEIENARISWSPEQKTSTEDLKEALETKIRELNPFKNLFMFNNKSSHQQLIYHKTQEGTIHPVGLLENLSAITIKNFLLKYENESFSNICKQLQPLINPKRPSSVSISDIVQEILNVLQPEFDIVKVDVTQDPHPAVLSTYSHIPALKYIPFTEQNVTIDDLNKYVKDFLLRTSDHEFLCAMIYINLIGKKTPYVLYLHGEGEDGKSSFVKMLCSITKSYGTYNQTERFGFYYMFGKSLIIYDEDSEDSYLLQQSTLKRITGGDAVTIERKNDPSVFEAEIRGQLIVTSNFPPKSMGTTNERRRLRYFFVRAHGLKDDEILGPDVYLTELTSKTNEFLNYCRQCYDKHKTSQGDLIKTPLNFDQKIREFRPLEEQKKFNNTLTEIIHIKKLYEFNAEGKCNMIELLDVVSNIDTTKYAAKNFRTILKTDYNIKVDGQYLVGIQKRQKRED
jgi:hypothetical protein